MGELREGLGDADDVLHNEGDVKRRRDARVGLARDTGWSGDIHWARSVVGLMRETSWFCLSLSLTTLSSAVRQKDMVLGSGGTSTERRVEAGVPAVICVNGW